VRRFILVPLVVTCLALVGCSGDDTSKSTDPTNAVAELGRSIDLGYDRTDWDPDALTAAMELAQRASATTVGCVDPGPVSFNEVKSSHELVKLPMPGATVQCFSVLEDEDLTYSAFADEQAKNDFIEAKAELICGRALAPESDPAVTTRFDGLIYIDAGNVIIEPDTFPIRDVLARELGATPAKMCPDAVGDRPTTTTTTTTG
jgi:hypothetical protein